LGAPIKVAGERGHHDTLVIGAYAIEGGVIRRCANDGRPRRVACGLFTFRAQMEIADVDDVRR